MLSLLSYIWLPILFAIIMAVCAYAIFNDSRFAKILRIIIWISIMISCFITIGLAGHEIWMGQ